MRRHEAPPRWGFRGRGSSRCASRLSSDEERRRGAEAGLKFDHVYEADELVSSDNTFFVATGATDGNLVHGVRRRGRIIHTESIVLRSRSGTIRRVATDHLAR